ncbi:MAG: segregation/condensation protein A [Acidobacteria bacterium]|jgi:segregation and condensation protein A|nr:MAG: segregation/condensation protein A [Acidobacteriota bacterium]
MWRFEEEHPFALAYRLVEEGKLDPWDVDISALARAYLEEIKRSELLDLRVPARAVLAASFLLKKQVDIIFPTPKVKKERKKLSLKEIVEEFESQEHEVKQEVIEKIEKVKRVLKSVHVSRERRPQRRRRFPIHVSKFEDALKELKELLKEKGMTFSLWELVLNKNPVPYLMALLVLYQEGLVELYQDKPCGELRVEVL